MMDDYTLGYCAANSPEGQETFDLGVTAGECVIADAFCLEGSDSALDVWLGFLQTRAGAWPTHYGLRLGCGQIAKLQHADAAAGTDLGWVVLVGDGFEQGAEKGVHALCRRGIRVYWEYAIGMGCPVEEGLLSGVVVRGCESGGISRSESVRTLYTLARSQYATLPIVVQGIESPEMVAVFLVLGAAGFILEGSAHFSDGLSPTGEPHAISQSGFSKRALGNDWVDVQYTTNSSTSAVTSAIGPGVLTFHPQPVQAGERPSRIFRDDVALTVRLLLDVTSDALDALCAKPTLIQGPLASISTSTKFACALSNEGIFPVFAFTGLTPDAVLDLTGRICKATHLSDYGIGIAGTMALSPQALMDSLRETPPSVILLSGDQWGQGSAWRDVADADVWLHVQHPAMVEQAWTEGFRHFVFEGCESGGHVGMLPSDVLWPLMMRASRDLEGETQDLHCVLAGGIHDAQSLLFGMLTAKAYGFTGQLSFIVGTRLLLTDAAVTSGALHAAYQKTLSVARLTQVVGTPGTGVRAAVEADGTALSPDSSMTSVYEAYGHAVKGEPEALCLAGESVAHCSDPSTLSLLFRELMAYGDAWETMCHGEACEARTAFRSTHAGQDDALAIVGVGGVFPGAYNVDMFWDNLESNQRQIQEVPPDYWGMGSYRSSTEDRANSSYSWHAGMITDFTFDHFDCLKFHISPKAAEVADRIHLMLLKATDQARVSAGVDFVFPSESTAVMIGNSMGGERTKRGVIRMHIPDVLEAVRRSSAFEVLDAEQRESLLADVAETLSTCSPETTEDSLVGGAASTLAGRISAYLKVFGGNMTVDAACASSLAAVTVASEMLRSGRCSCAVIGGVDSDLTIDTFASFCRLKALSKTISRPFMEGSDGFTMGEGAGVIILKRMDDALREGDHIYATLSGSGMSSDGEAGALTIPSPLGQRRALQRAFEASGFRPESIGYVEAHGTGTSVGDAVEVQELSRVFEGARPGSVALGTVKAHIGHLKSAAGIASIIKVIEAFNHKTIPPTWIEGEIRHDLTEGHSPFRLPSKAQSWRQWGALPLRAAISSFGFGGSNYHLHMEAFDDRQQHRTDSRLLLFSGVDRQSLLQKVNAFSMAVQARGEVYVSDPRQMCHLGGDAPCRLAVVWRALLAWSQLEMQIRDVLAGGTVDGIWLRDQCVRKKVAFLFPGQGSVGGDSFQQFRHTMPAFAARLAESGKMLDLDFDTLLWRESRTGSSGASWRKDPRLQPATTSLSLALAHLLKSVGVTPDAVAGHSLGFYAALVSSGGIAERDALQLLQERATCFDALDDNEMGTMLALDADAHGVEALLAECPVPCYLANMNSPNQTVVSLSVDDVQAGADFFAQHGVESQRLAVMCGFHSPFVADAGAQFEKHLRAATFHEPYCALYSETLGDSVAAGAFDSGCPDWFANHIVKPVRFVELLNAMHRDGVECFVEVGARGTLSRFARDTVAVEGIRCYPVDTARDDTVHHWHELLARLYVEQGIPIDFGAYAACFDFHLSPIRTGFGMRRPIADQPSVADLQEEGNSALASGSTVQHSSKDADDIYRKVRGILSEYSGFEESLIEPDHELQGTLGIDSLKTIEIGMEIERQLGARLTGSTFSGALTVRSLAEEVRCVLEGTQSLAVDDIKRYVLSPVEVPPVAAVMEPCGKCALLSNDPQLLSAWTEQGYGPSYDSIDLVKDPHEALHMALADASLEGIVYAVRPPKGDLIESSLLDVLRPVLALVQRQLPGRMQSEGRGVFHFMTATFSDVEHPEEAPLSAFSRSLQKELPQVRCGHVSFCESITAEAAVTILYQEAFADLDPYAFVSTCDAKRWVTDVVESECGDACELITASDVVLVTGGGRGITARMILALSATVTPTWIIVGSTDLNHDSESAHETKTTLSELKALGCRAEYEQCDLSDCDAPHVRIEAIIKDCPKITGVIHGAGVLSDSGIEDKSVEAFSRVVDVKSGSARILESMLDLSAIRFWVSMSSISALLGNAGQTDYAAASQDLVTQAYRLRGKCVSRVKTILWGPWSGVGMVVAQGLESRFKTLGIPMIGVEEGLESFCQELNSVEDAVVVYSGDLDYFADQRSLGDEGVWAQQRVVGAKVSLRSRRFDRQELFLKDHTIDGVPVFPGVMALELSVHAIANACYPLMWRDVNLCRLVTAGEDGLVLSMGWTPVGSQSAAFCCSDLKDVRQDVISGQLEWGVSEVPCGSGLVMDDDTVLRHYEISDLYGEGGLLFSGPLFQVLANNLDVGDLWARATLQRNTSSDDVESLPTRIPATLLDGVLQMAAVYGMHHFEGTYLPTDIDTLWCSESALTDAPVEAIVVYRESQETNCICVDAEITIKGERVLLLQGLTMSRVGSTDYAHS